MKTIIPFLLLIMSTGLNAGLGDMNNDGSITLADCKLLADAIARGATPDLSTADIDGDSTVSIVDAMRLHQSIGGLWIEPTGAIQPVPELPEEERAYFAQYEELCSRYEAMTPDDFIAGFQPAPSYTGTLDPQACQYFSVIDTAFNLTADQKQLLAKKGLVVLGNPRSSGQGFGMCYRNIFKHDLPVFFTSDALLDPLYKAYDDVLKSVENDFLIKKMNTILTATLQQLETLYAKHGSDPAWTGNIRDAATYCAVAVELLTNQTPAVSSSIYDHETVEKYLDLIDKEQPAPVQDFFGKSLAIDFSQFKPRGHYECMYKKATCPLSQYFKCMMWLGRADCALVFDTASLRQLRDFALIHHCMEKAEVLDDLSQFNQTISFFVGDVDGFSIEGLSALQQKAGIPIETIITSDEAAKNLIALVKKTGSGNQLILSQAMWKDPGAKRPDLPVIGQISGQRFILDSHLLGRTVEWYVKGRNKPLLEEVSFCLGNNAATPVVAPDITKYTISEGDYRPYHARLGASRVLFEKYPYWQRNLYTLWFDALRALSEPLNENVPLVMRSRSWQDKQMNTQLASWAELRHNTILYAKQSYTGGVTCFYPDGYVEPYPRFYRAIGMIVSRLAEFCKQMGVSSLPFNFGTWTTVTETLAAIAEQELQGKSLTEEHIGFLNEMLATEPRMVGCGETVFDGWYVGLFPEQEDCFNARPCIADVHTIPPSAVSPSNMVLHAATGGASYAIIQAATGNSCGTLFVGAVSSFHQHDESPVKRLTDSEWNSLLSSSPTEEHAPTWFMEYMK